MTGQFLSLQHIASTLRPVRRAAALASFDAFCHLHLASHFAVAPSSMHQEISELLVVASEKRGKRLAFAAPRGYAKTTLVCLAYVLWCLIRKSDPYILLISNTTDQAVQLLASLKKELEENPKLLEDFPEVCEPPGRKPSPKRWREKELITRNGVRVTALGAGQKLRGRKHGKDRPSLIILDDVEAEAEAHSAELREQRLEWFEKAVLKAGDTGHTNVIVIGTLLHYDSLLAKLVGIGNQAPKPGWQTRRYQAVISWAKDQEYWQEWENIYVGRDLPKDTHGPEVAYLFFKEVEAEMLEETEVLWPEKESYYQLMEMRIRDGRASFDSEKQNDPIAATNCLFDPEKMFYWDDAFRSEEELLAALGPDALFFGACDPSLGKQSRDRDDTGIITLVRHEHSGRLYVLDALIQKLKPSQTLDTIQRLYERRHYARFAIETNQFQEHLADQLESQCLRQGMRIRLLKINHGGDKVARIQSLEPLVNTGMLVFNRKHRLLIDQLRQFPRAAHDDGPDALEMAVEAAIPMPAPRIIVL